MTWIKTVPPEDASGALKNVYESWTKMLGFVPNIVASTSLFPDFTEAFENLRNATTFGGSGLGRRKEELIAMVVSAKNGCHY
ncbi:MAG: carboxymuconolactone decarboxylase family protein [Nitrospinota bacterium]